MHNKGGFEVNNTQHATHGSLQPVTKLGRATGTEERATPAQGSTIGAVGRWAGVNADRLCAERYGCRPVELSRRVAEEFLAELKSIGLDRLKISDRQSAVSGQGA